MERKIVISWKSKETLDDLQSKQARAENALETIKGLTDIPCNDINTLTQAFLRSFVAQKIAEVDRAGFLTSETKQSLIEEWRAKEKTALKAVKQIQEFIDVCTPEGIVNIQDGELTTDISLNEIADQKNLLDVPEEAFTHLELIESLRKAIRELREFEKAQNLLKINITDYISISEETLAEGWASGWLKKIDPKYIPKHRSREERGIVVGRSE